MRAEEMLCELSSPRAGFGVTGFRNVNRSEAPQPCRMQRDLPPARASADNLLDGALSWARARAGSSSRLMPASPAA